MIESTDILLVEDNPSDIELTLHSLRKYKLANSITIARDGLEALEYIFCTGSFEGRDINQRPKVILLDLKLPKVDGVEVLKRIRADDRTKTTPVVVLTSSREEQDIVKTYNLGINSYIVKPLDFGQFAESVRQLGFYWLFLNQPPVFHQKQ